MKKNATPFKRWQKLLVVAGVCVAVAAIGISMTMSHWWKVYRAATVTSDGRIISDVVVYVSRDEEFVLVHLKKDQELYLINLAAERISIPNRSSFVILPGLVFSRTVPPVGAPMGKADIDPILVISNESVEFTSVNHSRIRLGLKAL